MDWLKALSPFAPVFQTGLWVVLIAVGFVWCRPQLRKMVEALTIRIEGGASFKAGPIEIGPQLRELDYVAPGGPAEGWRPHMRPSGSKPAPELPGDGGAGGGPLRHSNEKTAAVDWAAERDQMYDDCRRVFLAHVISPSEKAGQTFDLFVFLIRHKSTDFSDVDFAEFFFGKYWGNKVFKAENTGGTVGVATSAYGPFLCTCRVHFRDGSTALLTRYVDFEMAKVIPAMAGPLQRTVASRGRG